MLRLVDDWLLFPSKTWSFINSWLSFSPGKDMKDKRLKEKKGEGQEDKIWMEKEREES